MNKFFALFKKKKKPRTPSFETYDRRALVAKATVLKSRLISETENRLNLRNVGIDYQSADRKIFEPFVDFSLINLGGGNISLYSYVINTGQEILDIVKDYETAHGTKVDKTDLYFALAMQSIISNSTINASVYWELCQREESHAKAVPFNPVASLHATLDRFTTVISAIEIGLDQNLLYRDLKSKYAWIKEFKGNLPLLGAPDTFAYFACGIRNRAGTGWLDEADIEMPKMYTQELMNSLCVLVEALIKDKPALSGYVNSTLGPLLNHFDLHNIVVSGILGQSGSPRTGLFAAYPTGSEQDFNTNFPLLIATVRGLALTDDEMKAHLLYGIFMLRNKALHNYNSTYIYYNNPSLFRDAIGLCFAAVPAILNC